MPKSSQPIEWSVGEEQFAQVSAVAGHHKDHGAATLAHGQNRPVFFQVLSWIAIAAAIFMAATSYFSRSESTSFQKQDQSSPPAPIQEPAEHTDVSTLEEQAIQEILAQERSMELGPQLAQHANAQFPTTADLSSAQSLVDMRHGGEVDPAIIGLQRREFLLDIKIAEPLAIATILVENPNDDQWHFGSYQERRFYQREGAKWRWADPKQLLRDPPQWIETVHLLFEFQEIEREYFLAIADEMESARVRLRKLVDPFYSGKEFRPAEPPRSLSKAPLTKEDEKLTLVSVPRDVPGLIGAGARQQIASPLVSRRPANFSDEEWLSQKIIERLVHLEVRKYVTTKVGMDYHRWDRMGAALNGWLQKELLGRRSPWHEEAAAKFQPAISMDALDRPLPLTILLTTDPMGWPSRSEQMQNYMLAETMIEYAVQTHGIGTVGDLLHGLSVHYTWGQLIPAVYGVPVDEFEAGWNKYLRTTSRSGCVSNNCLSDVTPAESIADSDTDSWPKKERE